MQTILITGANRGIGFELTRQFAASGDSRVFATCRRPDGADQLNALAARNPKAVSVLQLNISDNQSIDSAVSEVSKSADALDLLINNAGISGSDHARNMGKLTSSEVSHVMTTNAVSPLIVTQAFRDMLRRAANPRVVMISSGLGSLQRVSGSSYAYRMSKAAMNMAARVLAYDEAMAGVTTVMTNPGWVKTDMGGPNAALQPKESAQALLPLIKGLTSADNGKFFQYDGSELPW